MSLKETWNPDYDYGRQERHRLLDECSSAQLHELLGEVNTILLARLFPCGLSG